MHAEQLVWIYEGAKLIRGAFTRDNHIRTTKLDRRKSVTISTCELGRKSREGVEGERATALSLMRARLDQVPLARKEGVDVGSSTLGMRQRRREVLVQSTV